MPRVRNGRSENETEREREILFLAEYFARLRLSKRLI